MLYSGAGERKGGLEGPCEPCTGDTVGTHHYNHRFIIYT